MLDKIAQRGNLHGFRHTNAHLRNVQPSLQQHIACNLRDVATMSWVLTWSKAVLFKGRSTSQKLDLDEYPNISFAETIEIIYVSHDGWHNTSPKLKYYYSLINRR